MDKNTLSNYGWIVIAVLVLSVMIALATPFGGYIKNAVWNTTEGLFETEDAALGKVLDDMGIVPTTDQLQSKYKFNYYSTFSGAVTDVNNGTIGENSDATKDNATAGIYTDKGKTYVVLLKDTDESNSITITANVTINLGGNVLNCSGNRGIMNTVDSNNTINIDGRLEGSTICAAERAVQQNSGTLNINGGTYTVNSSSQTAFAIIINTSTGTVKNCTVTSTSSSADAYGIYFTASTTGTVENCTVSATSTSSGGAGIGILFGESSGMVKNCTATATSPDGTAYGMSFGNSSVVTVENCTVLGYANYKATTSGKITSVSLGIAVYPDANVNIKNCNVKGTHSGIQSHGNLTIDGGTYEGYGHGGLYLGGINKTCCIKNATLKQCDMPDGFSSNIHCNGAGVYIGGSSTTKNNTIYMDNCNIYGDEQPIVLRGTSGEKNNTLYISNSKINTDENIRIDGGGHKLYIGAGNNFTVDNTTTPSAVITTDEIYCQ